MQTTLISQTSFHNLLLTAEFFISINSPKQHSSHNACIINQQRHFQTNRSEYRRKAKLLWRSKFLSVRGSATDRFQERSPRGTISRASKSLPPPGNSSLNLSSPLSSICQHVGETCRPRTQYPQRSRTLPSVQMKLLENLAGHGFSITPSRHIPDGEFAKKLSPAREPRLTTANNFFFEQLGYIEQH